MITQKENHNLAANTQSIINKAKNMNNNLPSNNQVMSNLMSDIMPNNEQPERVITPSRSFWDYPESNESPCPVLKIGHGRQSFWDYEL